MQGWAARAWGGESEGPTADKAMAGGPTGPAYRSLEQSIQLVVSARSHVLVKGESRGLSVCILGNRESKKASVSPDNRRTWDGSGEERARLSHISDPF